MRKFRTRNLTIRTICKKRKARSAEAAKSPLSIVNSPKNKIQLAITTLCWFLYIKYNQPFDFKPFMRL